MRWMLFADPVRRRTIYKDARLSAIVALGIGLVVFLGVLLISGSLKGAAMDGLNTVALVFWIHFLMQLFVEVTKSDAVEEFERRVRQEEELLERKRITR